MGHLLMHLHLPGPFSAPPPPPTLSSQSSLHLREPLLVLLSLRSWRSRWTSVCRFIFSDNWFKKILPASVSSPLTFFFKNILLLWAPLSNFLPRHVDSRQSVMKGHAPPNYQYRFWLVSSIWQWEQKTIFNVDQSAATTRHLKRLTEKLTSYKTVYFPARHVTSKW